MKKQYHKSVVIWLITGAVMVSLMVMIGGITRLTESGLSMVDWNLFSGSIPPSNEAQWQQTFDNYKNYPEYQQVNFNMTLTEFKSIFFWEWLHRVLGRTIGIVFIIPFFYFLIKKKIQGTLVKKLVALLMLGAFQGFLGWFMVKSGLNDVPSVSHYRLALHLVAAFLTFSYIIFLILDMTRYPESGNQEVSSLKRLFYWFLPLLFLQIIFGAFVAGLDAGMVYPTWPKMGEYWIPPQLGMDFSSFGFVSLFSKQVSVQFIHRILAYLVFAYAAFLWSKSNALSDSNNTKKALNYLFIAIIVQVFLGISTLILHVPVVLGVMHQLGALMVLGFTVYLYFLIFTKKNVKQ